MDSHLLCSSAFHASGASVLHGCQASKGIKDLLDNSMQDSYQLLRRLKHFGGWQHGIIKAEL